MSPLTSFVFSIFERTDGKPVEDGPCGALTVDLCLEANLVIIRGFCKVLSRGGWPSYVNIPYCCLAPRWVNEPPARAVYVVIGLLLLGSREFNVIFKGVGESHPLLSGSVSRVWLMMLSYCPTCPDPVPHIENWSLTRPWWKVCLRLSMILSATPSLMICSFFPGGIELLN